MPEVAPSRAASALLSLFARSASFDVRAAAYPRADCRTAEHRPFGRHDWSAPGGGLGVRSRARPAHSADSPLPPTSAAGHPRFLDGLDTEVPYGELTILPSGAGG